MTDAHPVLPTDLLALVSYNGRSYPNEAWTRERIGTEESQNTLGLVLDQFLAFARGRSAWISVRRQRLQGLVGARRRGSRQAWEIDYLIDASPRHEVVSGLLECAVAEVGSSGAEKLFLRLAAESALLPAVREAGFMPYEEELLYVRGHAPTSTGDPGLRLVSPADAYALFRFYNLETPEVVRRSEAATFAEWHAAQERHWLKNGAQLIRETNGEVAAWIKAARLSQGVVLDPLISAAALDETASIIAAGVRAVDGEDVPALILLPQCAEGLARRLEDAGFEARGEFVSLMRRTTRPLALPSKILPAIAETPVGV